MAQEEVVVNEATSMESPKKPDTTPVTKSGSFKEESNVFSDLQESEKKALDELKSLLQAAFDNNEFVTPPPKAAEPADHAAEEPSKPEETTKPEEASSPVVSDPATPSPVETEMRDKVIVVDDDGAKTVEAIESTVVPAAPAPLPTEATKAAEQEKTPDGNITANTTNDVSIWGVSLLKDERSYTVLLKFLRARDFNPKEAMAMIKNTIKWRKEFGIEKLLEEDLGVPEMEKVVYMSGVDKQGHPVCYNVYAEFQNKELYDKAFGDQEKRQRFLRWRIQYLEKGIRELLDFSPGAVSTMVQVTDLKNSPGLLKSELRQALDLLQDNYPEFVEKQIFINVPWWYLAFNKMISPFLTQRTKSKFVFAGPAKSAEILFSYISPEQVPVRFGGLNQENDTDFSTAHVVTEVNMKPASKQIIEIPVTEKCLLVWELSVPGWEVTVGVEFVPSSEDGYTVNIQKSKKVAASDVAVAKNSFMISEHGKLVIAVDNATSKKKKLLYRYKAMDSADSTELKC